MEEIQDKIKEVLKNSEILIFKDLMDVNHKPHPYVIGPKHISYVSDYHGGSLDDAAIIHGEKNKKCKCAYPKCQIPYEEHTSDKVCFLQLKRECTTAEVQKELKSIVDTCGEKAFDGFTFVETDEKFRIV